MFLRMDSNILVSVLELCIKNLNNARNEERFIGLQFATFKLHC
jgi:hypothetical protein